MIKGLGIRRLSVQIALRVGGSAMLGAILIAAVSFHYILANELKQAKVTLQQLGLTVERTAAIAAYLDNREIADDAIHGLINNDIVAAAAIDSITGLTVSQGGDGVPADRGVVLALESPFIPGEVVGRLHIFPHHERIRDRARQRAIDQALLLGGYTLVVALLTLALIQVRYVPAIKTIANDLHDINPGDTERLSIPAQYRHNELGHLVRDINGLLDVVSTRLASERRLRQEIESLVQRFRLIYERASVGIFLCDRHGQLLMANAALHRIIGTRPPADPPDPPIDLASLFADVEQANALLTETLASGRETAADLRLAATDSQPSKWGHCLFTLIRDDEGESTEDPPLAQGILTDITARKQEELRIRFQAERDPLTQLYNRRSAESELDALLVQAASHRRDVAVCLLDLDHFKPINDRFGHDAGDLVLTTIADRLRTGLRSDDLIARLGGDEFLVAIPNHGGRQAVAIVADKLLGYLTQPVPLACGNTVQVGISIGIALASEQGYNAQRLVQLADRAMYRVKQGGKNGFAFC